MKSPQPSSKARAFTLIELLVVIAIIGILASLIFPAIGKATGRARLSKCTNNARNISSAALSYASSNLGELPTHGVPTYDGTIKPWMDILRDEMGEPGPDSVPVYTLECPELRKDTPLNTISDTHYAFNDNLVFSSGNNSKLPTLAQAKSRSAKLQEIDSLSDCVMILGCTKNVALATGASSGEFPHSGKERRGSVAFSDGHTASLTQDQATSKGSTFWEPKP